MATDGRLIISFITRLLFAAYFLEAGLILIVAPWSAFWDRNFFAAAFPLVDTLLSSPFVRGAVSGIGVITALAGLAELGGRLPRAATPRISSVADDSFESVMADLRRPIICLVTDRRRLPGPRTQSARLSSLPQPAPGSTLIHMRERDLDAALLALTRDVVAAAAGTTATVVVNDRVDLALAAGAGGVHLRGTRCRLSGSAGLRLRLSDRPVGASSGGRRPGRSSGVDYLVRTVFPSASKPENSPTVGVAALHRGVRDTARTGAGDRRGNGRVT